MRIRTRASPGIPNLTVEKSLTRTPPREDKSFPVVGIGASAGGLDAFTQLLRPLPMDTGMAFVLVQHLDPDHKSMLADILSRQTRLPVTEVKDKMIVQPNHIYIIPPNAQMSIRNGILDLVSRDETHGHFMPIDYFLRSLAADKGSQAIAVILSGADSDGTQALEAIKAEGGITFAQDPQSAKISTMPIHAAETGLVDFILPPERIADELIRISRDPTAIQLRSAPAEDLFPNGQDDLAKIFYLLRQARGVDFTNYKTTTLKRRITRRMVVHKALTLKEYVKVLKTDPKEIGALYDDILIHVTGFFRDPAIFESLKTTVFPQLLKNRAAQDPIRIWVPGCATGEEVYSIAMCLLEILGNQIETPPQLFATDISETALQRARAGVYTEQALSQIDPERRRRFFSSVNGGYQVSKSIKDLCVFAKQNVVNDPPFSKLDLISCRNVLIYLDAVLQKKVMSIFHYALKPNGLLLLGNSENLSVFPELFIPLDKKLKVYSKKAIRPSQHPLFNSPNYPVEKPGPLTLKSPADSSLMDLRKDADHYVLEKHAPGGVIIDGDMTVVEFRGPISHYLELVPGTANYNLLKLAKEGLLLELRPAIQKAKKGNVPVKSEGSRIKRDGHFKNVTIEVIPLKRSATQEPYFLVLFDEVSTSAALESKAAKGGRQLSRRTSAAADLEIARLKKELTASKDYLQSIINDQERINEELKSAHEEVLSSNEEFQSTNEELETAKEELQATNEETATLNEELQIRNAELNGLNNDLTNIMNRASNPIVILGKDHRIRRLTLTAGKLLNLTTLDIGQTIHDLKLGISIPELESQITTVLDSLTTQEREVQDADGHWHRMLVQPYKTSDDKVDGVVLSFADIQQAKERQATAMAWATELETRIKERTDQLTHTQNALHQAEKLEALGRLAGGVAHDFNNLMTGILGISEDLQHQLGPASPQRADLDDVINAARKAMALTRQLLAFGRRQVVAPKVLNLNNVITSMDALFRRLLGEDVEVKTLLDPHVGNVTLDQGQLEQLIVNLGLNARDAMLTGGTLTLETGNVDIRPEDGKRLFDAPPGPYIVLTVSDTGCGMTQGTIDHMFEPFFTTKEEGKGTGLGLANVYGIVKQAGGTIAVESQPDRGTTFRLYFPRADDARDSERRILNRREAQGGSETVLVVEDEDIVRKVIVKALRKRGYTILHAHGAEEALALIERHADPIHLLLTDVIMPGMSGHELGKIITAKRPDMKVLYMSGYNQEFLDQRGVRDQDINFIEKSFSAEVLCHKVREILDAGHKPTIAGEQAPGEISS